jgi:hypothetical protein
MDQVTQDLQGAYDYLEEHDWCQQSFSDGGNKVCLDGALRKSIGVGYSDLDGGSMWGELTDENRYSAAVRRLADVVRAEPDFDPTARLLGLIDFDATRGYSRVVWRWNDAKHRTFEDVKLILKKAIHSS